MTVRIGRQPEPDRQDAGGAPSRPPEMKYGDIGWALPPAGPCPDLTMLQKGL